MKGPRAEIYKRYFIFSIKPSGMPFSYYKVYTFSKNHSQPLALPNLLDQGLQAINQSLLLNPFNADLHHAQRPMKCWEERDTPSKLMRHRSTSINRNKASFDCSLERKSQKYWDTMDHLFTLYSPQLFLISSQELFFQDALQAQVSRNPRVPPL